MGFPYQKLHRGPTARLLLPIRSQRIQKAYGTGAALAPGARHPMALAVFENALAQASDHNIRLRHIFVDMLAAAPKAIYPSEEEG